MWRECDVYEPCQPARRPPVRQRRARWARTGCRRLVRRVAHAGRRWARRRQTARTGLRWARRARWTSW